MEIIDLRYEFNWNENNEKLDADINYVVERYVFSVIVETLRSW